MKIRGLVSDPKIISATEFMEWLDICIVLPKVIAF